MSITRQVTIWCDTCGNWEQESLTAKLLRKKLNRAGWECRDKVDTCPTCVKKLRTLLKKDEAG